MPRTHSSRLLLGICDVWCLTRHETSIFNNTVASVPQGNSLSIEAPELKATQPLLTYGGGSVLACCTLCTVSLSSYVRIPRYEQSPPPVPSIYLSNILYNQSR